MKCGILKILIKIHTSLLATVVFGGVSATTRLTQRITGALLHFPHFSSQIKCNYYFNFCS